MLRKIFILTLAFLNLASLCLLFYRFGTINKIKQTNAQTNQSGKIQIEVIDDMSGKPVDGATICIIETRHYETTNKHGKTEFIDVPIIRNQNFDLSLERPYGEFTILVYKDGYADNLSFYNFIKPETTRIGIKIRLRNIINPDDAEPTITVNSPDITWSKALIKLYKKQL